MIMRRILALLLCIAMVCVLFACGNDAGQDADPQQTDGAGSQDPTGDATVNENPVEDPSEEETTRPEDLPPIAVETAYGTLYFQGQWEEFMVVEQVETENGVTVNFSAAFNGNTYPLFVFCIGEGEGVLVGTVTDNAGNTYDVFASMMELEISDDLTDVETNRLYAMQEDINFVIDNLK